MPAADAAWLHMDRPANPMVVNSVIWFDEPLDWELVKGVISRRIVDQFPRFRRRVGDPLGRPPRFEDDAEFDIEQHLHRLALPAPGDQAALQDLVSDLITPPLDPTRPLWHAYLIDGYGNGCAMLFRIHHCIADGIALARVMLSLTDAQVDAGIAPPPRPGSSGRRVSLDAVTRPAGAAISAARRVTGAVVHEGLETLARPGPHHRACRHGEPGCGDARQAARLAPGHPHRPQGEPARNAAGGLVEALPAGPHPHRRPP